MSASDSRGSPGWYVVEHDAALRPFGVERTLGVVTSSWEVAEAWCSLAARRTPWIDRTVSSVPKVPSREGRGPTQEAVQARWARGPVHPTLASALDVRRRPWRADSLGGALDAVTLDALDDVIVWHAIHDRGGNRYEERVPVATFLEHQVLFEQAPGWVRPALLEAIARYRLPGRERCPSHAALHGDGERLAALLGAGSPIEHRDEDGRTPLAAALEAAHESIALDLLLRGASIENALEHVLGADAGGDPLTRGLEVAIRRRLFQLASLLVEKGADSNTAIAATTARGWELALVSGAPAALLSRMLACGARLDAASPAWTSAVFVASARREPSLAAMSPVPLPPIPVMAAPGVGDVADAAERRARADAARARDRAQRALVAAVVRGDTDTMRAHAEVAKVRGADGQLPLHHVGLAPPDEQANVIAVLVSMGVEIDAKDSSGATALTKSVRRNALAAVQGLLRAGASPVARDEHHAAIVHAVLSDAPDIIDALLAAGASATDTDASGRSAIEVARAKGRTACLARLSRA